MRESEKQKLILAVLSGDDYEDTISDLTQHGFFVTVLNSSGGFFRRKNVTIMIGTEASKCEQILKILKENAGLREQTTYQNLSAPGCEQMTMVSPIPVKKMTGGATVFIMDLCSIEKL
ncbi:MAG: transcriptional regulator [Firmicutes bacterium]|nr:transcriptional regulator [Bacillota bacterium]